MAASPSSSPRLPSPPPIAEDQLGPKSPIAMPNEHGELGRNPFEGNALRRIRPGTKAADMAMGPPLVPLTDIDSPFQLTEHLKSLHNAALHRDGSSTISPIDRETATRLAQPPDAVDKYLWLYELCRLLCKEINAMIVALFQDDPPCSAQTCNEMRASEWQYLCAVHDPPKPCCAIDYCCHTLDWTNHVLTSQKNFPSRMSLGADSGAGHQQLRQLTNIFRRVYRIFAHAWFQHREMYWKVELKSGLYVFFKTVCDVYNLIPEDNYTVPPEAEGIEPTPAPKQSQPSMIKRREDNSGMDHERTENEKHALKPSTSAGTTTQRHRHTPSIGSESITTVLEDPEEEDEKTSKLEETVILSNEPPEDLISESHKEDAATEVAGEPSKVEPNPADTTDTTETTTELPTIAIEHIEEHDAPSVQTLSTEPGVEEETDVGEKAESAASDTDSHGSWQVLTNEPQSNEGTPATSVMGSTEVEMTEREIKAEEPGTKSESSHQAKEIEAEPLPQEESGSSKGAEADADLKDGSTEHASNISGSESKKEDKESGVESEKDAASHLAGSDGDTAKDPQPEAKDPEAATDSVED